MQVVITGIQDGKRTRNGNLPKILNYTFNGNADSILVFDATKLQGIGVGDTCDLNTSQNGKYTNFESISVVKKGEPSAAVSSAGGKWMPEDPKKQEAIHRSVALEYATATVVAFGGKITVSKAITDVLDVAQAYYKFLQNGEVDAENETPDGFED